MVREVGRVAVARPRERAERQGAYGLVGMALVGAAGHVLHHVSFHGVPADLPEGSYCARDRWDLLSLPLAHRRDSACQARLAVRDCPADDVSSPDAAVRELALCQLSLVWAFCGLPPDGNAPL